MTCLVVIWLVISISWILYRVFIMQEFLLWNWSDGKFERTADKYRRWEDERC